MSAMALASPPETDMPQSSSSPRPPGMPKVNSNTENLLKGSFEAYGGDSGRIGAGAWNSFCADCKLAEGNLTSGRLDAIFGGHATPGARGRGLTYHAFIMALAQVSEEKYGVKDSLARLVYFKIVRFAKTLPAHRRPSPERTSPPPPALGPPEATNKRFGLLHQSPRTPPPPAPGAALATAHLTPALATPSPRQTAPHPASNPPVHRSFSSELSPSGLPPAYPSTVLSSSPSNGTPRLASPNPTTPRGTMAVAPSPPDTPLSPGERASLLRAHKDISADCDALRGAASLLIAAYEYYRDLPEGLLLQSFVQMCSDLGLLPARLSYSQVRDRFIATVPRARGAAGGVADYVKMVACLRSCADAAYGGGSDSTELLIARMRAPPSLPSFFSQMAAASSDAGKQDWVQTDFSVRGGGGGGEAGEGMGLERSLEALAAEHARQVENLVAQSSERQIAFTLERKHMQETLEDDLTQKHIDVAAKLPYFLAKFKPSQAVLSLRAQICAIDGMRNPVDFAVKRRLEKELVRKEAEDKLSHEHKARQEHAVHLRTCQEQCVKARTRFDEETKRLLAELNKEMEDHFEMIRLRFEAKQHHLNEVHKVRFSGASAQTYLSPAPTATPSTAQALRTTPVPMLKLPQPPVVSTLQPRRARGGLRRATQRLSGVMREAFDCVFEAFVVMDADGDDHIVRQDLKRMMARMSVVDITVDQVLSECKLSADGGLGCMSFSQQFKWHSLGSQSDMKVLYSAIKQDRRSCLDKFERWRTGHPLPASSSNVQRAPGSQAEAGPSPRWPPSARGEREGGENARPNAIGAEGAGARGMAKDGSKKIAPKRWESDAVRKAKMEKLEREKRSLAIKLLDAERRLAMQAPSPEPALQSIAKALGSAKKPEHPKPAFIGPQGKYFERGGQKDRGDWVLSQGGCGVDGGHAGARLGGATPTGLWAVPLVGSARKAVPETDERQGEGQHPDLTISEGWEEDEFEEEETLPSEVELEKFRLGVLSGGGEGPEYGSPQSLSAGDDNGEGGGEGGKGGGVSKGGMEHVVEKQDEWLDSCIELISGLVDKHRKRPSTSKDAQDRNIDQAASRQDSRSRERSPDEAALSQDSRSRDKFPDEAVATEPHRHRRGSELLSAILSAKTSVPPATFGLVLDETASVLDDVVKRGVAEDVAKATGVHPSKVRIGSVNAAQRTLYITILADPSASQSPLESLEELRRQVGVPHAPLMYGEFTRHSEAIVDAGVSLSGGGEAVVRGVSDPAYYKAVSAPSDISRWDSKQAQAGQATKEAVLAEGDEDEWHSPREGSVSPQKASCPPRSSADEEPPPWTGVDPLCPSPSPKKGGDSLPTLDDDDDETDKSDRTSLSPPVSAAECQTSSAFEPSLSASPIAKHNQMESVVKSDTPPATSVTPMVSCEEQSRDKRPSELLDSSARWDISPDARSTIRTLLSVVPSTSPPHASTQGPAIEEAASTVANVAYISEASLSESDDDEQDDMFDQVVAAHSAAVKEVVDKKLPDTAGGEADESSSRKGSPSPTRPAVPTECTTRSLEPARPSPSGQGSALVDQMLVADKGRGKWGSSRVGKGGSSTLQGGRDGEWFRKQLLAETSEEEDSEEEDRGQGEVRKPLAWSSLATHPASKNKGTASHVGIQQSLSESDDDADYAFDKAMRKRRQ